MLRIQHPEYPVGNLVYVISCSCGWDSARAGDGAREDAIADGRRHQFDCELARSSAGDQDDSLDFAI
jgi:hypothetical protein